MKLLQIGVVLQGVPELSPCNTKILPHYNSEKADKEPLSYMVYGGR